MRIFLGTRKEKPPGQLESDALRFLPELCPREVSCAIASGKEPILGSLTQNHYYLRLLDRSGTLGRSLEERPCYVWGHEPQLYRVLSNLVANAIQYTPAGGEVVVKLDSALTGRSSGSSIRESVFLPRNEGASSIASTGFATIAPAIPEDRGWDWRSCGRSSKVTRGRSTWKAPSVAGVPLRSNYPAIVKRRRFHRNFILI